MAGTVLLGETHFIEFGADPNGEPVKVNVSQIRKYQSLDDNRARIWWANGDVEVLRKEALYEPEEEIYLRVVRKEKADA
jgi:hypothetical protein